MVFKKKENDVNKIASNFSWIMLNKVINIVSGLVISAIVVRYLGAERNGTVNYVASYIALFGVVARFGMQNIIVKEFAANRDSSGTIAFTAACISAIGGLGALVLSVGLAVVLSLDKYLLYIIIESIAFLTYPCLVFEYWFVANSKSKYYTITQSVTYIACLAAKLVCVALRMPLVCFVIITTLETVALNLGLALAYKMSKIKLSELSFDIKYAKRIVSICWPLIFSSLAITIYMKCDQLMIGTMLGDYDLGIYSVAVRLSEYWYFIPGAIYTSCFPIISKYAYKNKEKFMSTIQAMSDILAILGTCAIIAFSLLSNVVVYILYGAEYIAAGQIMVIYIWAGLFVSLSNVKLAFCTVYEYSKIQLATTGITVVLNIILNYLLIPQIGITGAAVATVITQALNSWISCAFFKCTREIFIVETKSIFFILRVKAVIKNIKNIFQK